MIVNTNCINCSWVSLSIGIYYRKKNGIGTAGELVLSDLYTLPVYFKQHTACVVINNIVNYT